MQFCPACQFENEDESKSCSSCGFDLIEERGHGHTIVPAATRVKVQAEVALVFDIDRTGSSLGFVKGIPQSTEGIARAVKEKARSVRTWVMTHGDLEYDEEHILHLDGGTVDEAIAEVKRIEYSGGGDSDETHLDAIEYAIETIPWASDPRKGRSALVSMLSSDTKQTRSGATARDLGEELKRRGILTYLICEPTRTLNELVNAASGLMFPISDDPNPKDLLRIGTQVSASIIATVTRGGTVPLTR